MIKVLWSNVIFVV